MPALYGASLAGVQAILSHRVIDVSSEPSAAQVTTWVEQGSARVFARVGSLAALSDEVVAELGGLSIRAWATSVAKHASELYAAGMAEGAGLPELARPNDVSSFATWLMQQYEAAVEELIALVDRYTVGEGVPDELPEPIASQLPAYSFPAVTFPDDMRF